jgi:hypothetical protein
LRWYLIPQTVVPIYWAAAIWWEYADNQLGELAMGISPASGLATNVAVGTLVLKKAIDIQAQTAMILIDSIAQTQTVNPANLPPNLGQNINTTAWKDSASCFCLPLQRRLSFTHFDNIISMLILMYLSS